MLALAAPASAQVSLLSREVQSAMMATGSRWNHSLRPDLSAMREAFAALHAVAPKDGVVVTKDVAPGTVVAGNPARVLRPAETI